MVIGYTTADKIRAVLGLTTKELKDSMISDLGIADMLSLNLGEVYPAHEALKAAIDGGSPTTEESRLWSIMQLYTAHQAACYLLPQLQMIVVKRISDGDVEMVRFGPDDLAQLRSLIQGRRDEYLNLLNPDLPVQTGFSVIGLVAPSYDPVTNEGA